MEHEYGAVPHTPQRQSEMCVEATPSQSDMIDTHSGARALLKSPGRVSLALMSMAAFVGALSIVPAPGSGTTGGGVTVLSSTVYGTDGSGNGSLAEAHPLSFSTSNEYGSLVSEYKWSHIAEPYRVTTLTAKVAEVYGSTGTFAWMIVGDDNESFEYEGVSVEHTFKATGGHAVSLRWTSEDDSTSLALTEATVMCKYVRRELRTLTDDDRDRFLDTLRTLYDLRSEDGQAKYGARYNDIYYFVKKHLHGAAAKDCDHWHDNAGIVTHHLAFTLELEQALQSVDPTISVPYWEYTKDAILYESGGWQNSVVFLDEWFGVASPTNQNHVVTEGRWAYTPVLSDADGFSNITNSYGLLRSPWNTNSVPYFTRYDLTLGHAFYTNFPTCSQFSECVRRDSLAKINECLNGETHGPVHIMIGGQWGSVSSNSALMTFGLAPQHLLLAKNLWRHGYVRCPETCDDEASSSDCKCSCPASVMDGTPYEVLTDRTGLMHWIDSSSRAIFFNESDGRYHIKGYTPQMETDAWEQILAALCDPGHAGEMYTSAAPYDPTFWVLHTTAERLLQFRRLKAAEVPLDETWGFAHMNAASDVGVVCDWSNVGDGEGQDTLPTCTAELCEGHGASDLIPFTNFLGKGETYTNHQFYDFIEPNNDELPYLYDSFSWTHCDEIGVSMDVTVPSTPVMMGPPPDRR